METVNATIRKEDFGSAGSRRLIAKGFLPAEMYSGSENIHIVLNAHDFDLQLRKIAIGSECEVSVEGKAYKCILKDLQENIMKGILVHADFQIVK